MGLLNCCFFTAALGLCSFLAGRRLPESWFSPGRFPYRSWRWEKEGRFYQKYFHIKAWQARVPDMSRIFPGLIQPKKVTGAFVSQLPGMIRETCIAELVHFLLCLASPVFLRLWPGPGGLIFALLYILGNLPLILIQRYNRPRLVRMQEKLQKTERKSVNAHFDSDLQHGTGTQLLCRCH